MFFEIESEKNSFFDLLNFDTITSHLGEKKENSGFINCFDNNISSERSEDSDPFYDGTKKSHNPIENFKDSKPDHVNCHDNKKNEKDNIFNSYFIENQHNYSQKEGDNLGLLNKRNSQNFIKNKDENINKNNYNSKKVDKYEHNFFKSRENLEKNNKINNISNKQLFKTTFDNDDPFKSFENFSPIKSDNNMSFIFEDKFDDYIPFLPDISEWKTSNITDMIYDNNKYKLLDIIDYTTKPFSSKNNFSLSKECLNTESDCQNNFLKNEGLDYLYSQSRKSNNIENNNNNELENNSEVLSRNAIFNIPNNNQDQRSNKNFLNKKKNLPKDNNNYNDNIDVFNIQKFKKNYENIYSKKFPSKIKPPSLLEYEEIKKKFPDISQLWSGDNKVHKIYTDEEDFNNTIKSGKITRNILNILNNKKEKIDLKRWHQPDEMCQKYKTLLIQESINSINTYDEFINNKIEIIDKYKIYEIKKVDFNLILLEQKIHSIISNDINGRNPKSNFLKIKKIMDEYDENGEHSSLFEHLNLTLQDVLDIILYNNANNKFDAQIKNKFRTKLIEFLNKVYKNLKDDEKNKKDEKNEKDESNTKDEKNEKDESNKKDENNKKDGGNKKDENNKKDETNKKDGGNK